MIVIICFLEILVVAVCRCDNGFSFDSHGKRRGDHGFTFDFHRKSGHSGDIVTMDELVASAFTML